MKKRMKDPIERQDVIDAIEGIDWYHQNKNKDMVHGANSSEDQAWYKADDIYKTLEALPSAQQWIPCSERLPEENTPVLLGVRFKDDFKYFVTARVDYNYWTGLGRDIRGELAWMPLPEPYKGEQDDNRRV